MKSSLLSAIALTASVFCATAHAASQYLVYDLGTLGGGYSVAYGLNNAGQVVGESTTTGGLESRPFVATLGGMTDLGNMSPGGYTQGFGINALGAVAGASYNSNFTIQSGFLHNGSYVNLGSLGGSQTTGNAINDSGQVAGTSYLAGNSNFRAFIYSNGVMTSLGTLGGTKSEGRGINNAGQVTGRATLSNGNSRAFLYSSGTGMLNLGTLGGSDSSGSGINDAGYVTGESALAGNSSRHAFIYNGSILQDLGTLGGTNSGGSDINNFGQVVGTSDTLNGSRAFLYDSGTMFDLNNLVTNLGAAGFSFLDYASAINENGWIAGSGLTLGNETHAFLAVPVPVPEPGTGIAGLLCVGIASIVRARSRVRGPAV